MGSRIALTLAMLAAAALCACEDSKPTPDAAPLPVDSGIDATSACGGTIPYLQACTADDACFSCVCRSFGHSMICTQACTGDGDCPAPSGGCSAGFCRP